MKISELDSGLVGKIMELLIEASEDWQELLASEAILVSRMEERRAQNTCNAAIGREHESTLG